MTSTNLFYEIKSHTEMRRIMATLKVKEMSCNHCVERIHKALEAVNIQHNVDLETKTVQIDGTPENVATAIEELADIGFTAEAV